MCGIAGVIQFNRSSANLTAQLKTMSAAIINRGPDDHGYWESKTDRKVLLAHRRLSIIDLSKRGHQPMLSNDGRFVLVYNGELYNYLELRQRCIELGSKFTSDSDSEVIIECFRHFSTEALSLFRGMWAFALLDQKTQSIVLARDRFAIKPLYYSLVNGNLYFSSEPKGLACLGSPFNQPDPITADLFLQHGYIERGDWTFYSNIKRFPHAHFTVIDLHKPQCKLEPQRYWQKPNNKLTGLSFKQASEQCRELLEQSIKLHLRSDTQVGSCLSGGLDSSAIVCIAKKHLANNTAIDTFTSHFPKHESIDETKWANLINDYCQTNSHFAEPTLASFKADLDDLLLAQGEPFGSTSIYTQYCVFKRIAETSIKVVLDGQGADELFAGYHGFIPIYLESLTKQGRLFSLLKETILFRDSLANKPSIGEQVKKFISTLRLKKGQNSAQAVNSSHENELEARLQQLHSNYSNFDQQLDDLLLETNVPQLLRYEDRNSMHFSIESRVPFLDSDLVDFILQLNAGFKLRNGWTKAVLRHALRGLIPEKVRTRRDKLGFPAPEQAWLKEAYSLDVAGNGSATWRQFIYQRWLTHQVMQTYKMQQHSTHTEVIS